MHALLCDWTVDGYLQWLQNLQHQYRVRRDWLVGALAKSFILVETSDISSSSNARSYKACVKTKTDHLRTVFRFVDPTAGMFLWTKFEFDDVPRFMEIESTKDNDPEQTFAAELWKAWSEELVSRKF